MSETYLLFGVFYTLPHCTAVGLSALKEIDNSSFSAFHSNVAVEGRYVKKPNKGQAACIQIKLLAGKIPILYEVTYLT